MHDVHMCCVLMNLVDGICQSLHKSYAWASVVNVWLGFLFLTSSVVADRLVLSSQRFNIDGQAVESYMLVRPAMLAHILPALADQKFGLSNLTGRGFVACLDFWDPTRPAMPAPHFTISVPNGWAVSGINGSICEPLVLFGACMLEAWPDKLNL